MYRVLAEHEVYRAHNVDLLLCKSVRDSHGVPFGRRHAWQLAAQAALNAVPENPADPGGWSAMGFARLLAYSRRVKSTHPAAPVAGNRSTGAAGNG